MIPTRDTVFVLKQGELDDWGRPTPGETLEFPCRIDYQTQVVQDDNGEEVVSKVQILIKGFANITTDDELTWEDEYGFHEVDPISVSPIKDLGSKILFTKVVG